MAETIPSAAATDVYEHLESYNWDADQDFKNGLEAILGANPSPEQAAELTLRARCFYYARKFGTDVDFDGYKSWRKQHTESVSGISTTEAVSTQPAHAASSTSDQEQSAPYPTSFAQIVDLISSGKPIPGIKDVPDTVLTGQGTASSAITRKKPWEKESDQTESAATVAQGNE
ncbi:MAG: hypothetical protein M1821_003285 [Bathelium mastoideum]|nr:MAG: hypothetical protein M1821_003285 [Bathelium mastoideum]KAI9689357.1 MAG: hypothetical protein M1822_010008 [Bathelium mastoideum]